MKKWWNLSVLLKTYLIVIPIFFCFRFMLFLTEMDRISSFGNEFSNIIYSFLMGIRFDLVITGYILFFPFLVLSVLFVINRYNKIIIKALFWFVFVLMSVSFAVCAADIPYFNQFFSRFSMGAFLWIGDSPKFVIGMILQEPQYFLIIIPYVIIVFLFYKLLRWSFKAPEKSNVNVFLKMAISIVFMGLIFLGVRGRIEKKTPILVSTAYFCNNAFLNQLGLNPVFTLMRSYLDSRDERYQYVRFSDDQVAIGKVQEYLNIREPINGFPVARYISPDTINLIRPNVVLIMMESMSAAKMKRHGNTKNLTPFLDSLSTRSLYFENIYTAGKHTYSGIFSTLFSFPAVYYQNPMKESSITRYNGLSHVLKKNEYNTCYFTTHDSQFDNVEGFLRTNDFDRIVSQKDYPSEEIKSNLGVPDDYMFRFSIPVIDGLHEKKKPFMVAMMTCSDHGPFIIPDYFKPDNSDIQDQIVEYADWSLSRFFKLASTREWFANTIFVLVADHGAPISSTYEISLDYFHTPLIYHAPGILPEPKSLDCVGGQIDVFPTLMGMLKIPYLNNTMGIDLLKDTRPFIMINDDDKLGVLDKDFFLIMKKDNSSSLFRYRNMDKTDFTTQYPAKAAEMEEYLKSNLQVFQYIIKNNKMYLEEPFR